MSKGHAIAPGGDECHVRTYNEAFPTLRPGARADRCCIQVRRNRRNENPATQGGVVFALGEQSVQRAPPCGSETGKPNTTTCATGRINAALTDTFRSLLDLSWNIFQRVACAMCGVQH